MVSSRKNRIVALSAVLLTVVFIFITTHNRSQGFVPVQTHNTVNNQQANTETTTRIGAIDESAIKSNEDKIKQKLQQAQQQQVAAKDKEQAVQAPKLEDSSKGVGIAVQKGEDGEPFDAAGELKSILSLSPVVVFSKTSCGFSAALKNLLKSEYEISPAPTIVELDKHKRGRELQDFIASKSGRKTVPNLFVNGISRGGSDEMRKLHKEGKLLSSLTNWGERNIKVTKINAPSNS